MQLTQLHFCIMDSVILFPLNDLNFILRLDPLSVFLVLLNNFNYILYFDYISVYISPLNIINLFFFLF